MEIQIHVMSSIKFVCHVNFYCIVVVISPHTWRKSSSVGDGAGCAADAGAGAGAVVVVVVVVIVVVAFVVVVLPLLQPVFVRKLCLPNHIAMILCRILGGICKICY